MCKVESYPVFSRPVRGLMLTNNLLCALNVFLVVTISPAFDVFWCVYQGVTVRSHYMFSWSYVLPHCE